MNISDNACYSSSATCPPPSLPWVPLELQAGVVARGRTRGTFANAPSVRGEHFGAQWCRVWGAVQSQPVSVNLSIGPSPSAKIVPTYALGVSFLLKHDFERNSDPQFRKHPIRLGRGGTQKRPKADAPRLQKTIQDFHILHLRDVLFLGSPLPMCSRSVGSRDGTLTYRYFCGGEWRCCAAAVFVYD